MANAARQALKVFRNDPMHLVLEIVGENLNDANFSFAVKLDTDQPGSPLLGPLSNNDVAGDPGVRLVTVEFDDGVPITVLEIIAEKADVQALRTDDLQGEDLELVYDFEWTAAEADESDISPIETTRLYGPFIVMGSVNA